MRPDAGGVPFQSLPYRGSQTDHTPHLSRRQLECLYWTQMGKSASDIGGILHLSSRTVEGHIANVCHLLGVRTKIQAVSKAKDLGLIGSHGP